MLSRVQCSWLKSLQKVLVNLKNVPIMKYIDVTTRFGLIDAIDKNISSIN